MKVTGLFVYPVKALGGISLAQTTVKPTGIPYDREWMLTDDKGNFVSQRQLPALAQIKCTLSAHQLELRHPSGGRLSIGLETLPQQQRSVVVWGSEQRALDEGRGPSEWLTDLLGPFRGGPLHLVRFGPDDRRNVSGSYLKDGESAETYFSDGYPYLVASESSLAHLNAHLQRKGSEAVTMDRFRANIIVDGLDRPFAELEPQDLANESGRIRIGLRKPCERCPVTTIDQQSGQRMGKEPLPTLMDINPMADTRGAFFGGNGIVLNGSEETLAVGDRMFTSADGTEP